MLQKLYERQGGGQLPSNLQVVVVPAIGLDRPSEWVDPSGSWLKTLLDDVAPQAQAWEYVYSLSDNGSTIVQQLLASGYDLLECLSELSNTGEGEPHPILFICHGVGGFVLEKALCVARDHHFQYRSVIDVISGAIFLGVPNFASDQKQAMRTLELMLKCQHKRYGKPSTTEADVQAIVNLCTSFELVTLRVPVVSAFESRATQVQKSVFAKFRKSRDAIIVTKSLCRLNAKLETLVDGESNHLDICKVPIGSTLFKATAEIFKDVVQNAPRHVAERFKTYSVPTGLKNVSLRSHSTTNLIKPAQQNLVDVPSQLAGVSVAKGTSGSTAASFEIVPQVSFFEITHKALHLPCFSMGVHKRNNGFYGREDILIMIDSHLLHPLDISDPDRPKPLRSFAICGLGGMGKTELAVEYAFSRREQFEAVFWLVADDADILAESFARIAQQLGLEDSDVGQDLAASRELVKGWLSNPVRQVANPDQSDDEARWLLIFDNVDDLDVLSDYWPTTGRGSVLVTSRDPLAKCNLYTVNDGIDLPPLSSSATMDLIQRLTRIKPDQSQQGALSSIADKLGGLPLAISHMSSVIRDSRMSYTEFLKFYEQEGIEQLQMMQKSSDKSQNARSLATVWALHTLSPATTSLLQILSILDPDNIPEYILTQNCADVELTDYPKSRGSYYAARAQLLRSSLIYQNAEQEQLSLHRLIQDTTKSLMTQDRFFAVFQTALSLVSSVWPFQKFENYHSVARFGKCAEIFPCVLRLKNGVESLVSEKRGFSFDNRVTRLLNDAGWYLFERGLPEQSKSYFHLALTISEHSNSNDSEEVRSSIRESHCFLGCAAAETNDGEMCLKHHSIWLDMAMSRKSDAGTPVLDYELGIIHNEVGVAYAMNEMFDEAAKSFLRSIEVFQSLEKYEDTMLGWPEPNLGFMYWLQGRLEDAERVLVEILEIFAAAYGVDDTQSFKTGKILYGLGNVLESQGRFDESLHFHHRCLEQYRKTLGTGHHRTGDICHRLGGHYMRLGTYKEAETYLAQALKIFQDRPSFRHELARTTFKKGQLLRLMGRESEADDVMAQAYKIRRHLMPQDVRPLEQLAEDDFDKLVIFWSR